MAVLGDMLWSLVQDARSQIRSIASDSVLSMKLVLGQTAEHEGKYVMRRAIEIPADELKKLPAKQIKGILFHAYMQLLEVERDAEIAELNKLLETK